MTDIKLTDIKNKKILLVGGTGFIGRHILFRLLELDAEVTVMSLFRPGEYNGSLLNRCHILKGDITQVDNRKFISGTHWNIVINVGGFINQEHDSQSNAENFTGHLLHVRELVSILPTTIERFVHAGSAVEYGDNPAPHIENMRERPLNPYAAAKVAATHYLQMLHRSIGFPSVILRPFYIYGPGQDQGKFLPWVIEQAILDKEIKMTKGDQTKDPIHVSDVAEAFIRASIADRVLGEIINIASGMHLSLAEMVNIIVKKVNRGKIQLGALPYRRGEIMRSEADVAKFRNLLKINQVISFTDGIQKYLTKDISP